MHMHSNRHHHLLITSSFKSRQNVHYRNTIAKETGSSFQQTFQLLRGTHLVNPIGFCSLLLFFFCLPKSQIDSSRLYLAAHLHITSLEQESCHRIVSFAVRICVLPCNSFHVILSQFFSLCCSIDRRCIVSYTCIFFILWIICEKCLLPLRFVWLPDWLFYWVNATVAFVLQQILSNKSSWALFVCRRTRNRQKIYGKMQK